MNILIYSSQNCDAQINYMRANFRFICSSYYAHKYLFFLNEVRNSEFM